MLFGALLFASAGTFTSCKDYDDDINNLQEQINTINTTLEELTSKINGLGAGVTDFKYENGKLVIVTDKGTNFEVTLPEADGIKELEIKDGILYADGVAVGAVAGEGGAVSVEVKDGVLYINGEAQELNDEVGSKVVVVDNGNGTYTLTVDGTSIVLPKASASVGIVPTDQVYFTNLSHVVQATGESAPTWGQNAAGGILWGTADSYRGNWKGLKSVAKGQLLVGQISTVLVRVNAATFDLETAKLTLVNTLGKEAPVTVTPVALGQEGPWIDAGTRAADENGIWNLKIEMNSDVTATNIGTAFAAKNPYQGYAYKNVRYALAIDGKVATDYIYYVDTQESKASAATKFSFTEGGGNATTYLAFNEKGVEKKVIDIKAGESVDNVIPIGTSTTFSLCPNLTSVNQKQYVDRIYDSYIEIKDEDLAEKHGITAEGMTLNVSADAAALTEFPIVIHVLDIHGNETESAELKVNFASSVATGQELQDQAYTIIPSTNANKQFVLVDLGNTFTGLTADEAVAISTDLTTGNTGAVEWYSVTDNKLFKVIGTAIDGGLKSIDGDNAIKYYATKEDALKYGLEYKKDVTISFNNSKQTIDVKAATIRKIAYAVVPVSLLKNDATPDTKAPFTVILKDKDNNEIRRVSAQYTINLPSFDDVLEANSDQNLWNDGTFTTRVSATNDGQISLVRPFKSKTDGTDAYIDLNKADGQLYYDLVYTDFDDEKQYVTVDNAQPEKLTGTIIKDHKLVQNIDATATLYLLGDKNTYPNFKVTKEFKVYLQSVFEGASLSYYVEGKAVEGAMTLEQSRYIYAGVLDAKGKPSAGMFITYDGETLPYAIYGARTFTNGIVAQTPENSVKPIKKDHTFTKASSVNAVQPYIYLKDGAVGQNLSAVKITNPFDSSKQLGVLDLVTVPANASGAIEITFVDKMDVYTTVTLSYKK